MALQPLEFTKDWTNPEDFPTVEISETKVREDMQYLFDEIKTHLNGIVTALEGLGVEHAALLPENAGMKYLRYSASGSLEVSTDGETWIAVAGSGGGASTVPAHAARHAKDGDDPLTPGSIGAYTKAEADAAIKTAVGDAMGGSY